MLRKRSELLGQVESEVTNPAEMEEWYDTRLDRWVADWALRAGYNETAHRFVHEKEIEVDTECPFSNCYSQVIDRDMLILNFLPRFEESWPP